MKVEVARRRVASKPARDADRACPPARRPRAGEAWSPAQVVAPSRGRRPCRRRRVKTSTSRSGCAASSASASGRRARLGPRRSTDQAQVHDLRPRAVGIVEIVEPAVARGGRRRRSRAGSPSAARLARQRDLDLVGLAGVAHVGGEAQVGGAGEPLLVAQPARARSRGHGLAGVASAAAARRRPPWSSKIVRMKSLVQVGDEPAQRGHDARARRGTSTRPCRVRGRGSSRASARAPPKGIRVKSREIDAGARRSLFDLDEHLGDRDVDDRLRGLLERAAEPAGEGRRAPARPAPRPGRSCAVGQCALWPRKPQTTMASVTVGRVPPRP